MDFSLNEEQIVLKETVAALLNKTYANIEDRRRIVGTAPGYSENVWQQFAELGALALPFPESLGGAGVGPMEVAIVAEEIGRVLAPEPYSEVVVRAGGLIHEAGSLTQQQELIERLVSGELLIVTALREPGRRWDAQAREVTAQESAGAWTLSGVKQPVIQAGSAGMIIVSARVPNGTGLFLLDPATDGVRVETYRTHDGGWAGTLYLDQATVQPLGEPGADQQTTIETIEDRARLLLAHEGLGVMEVALEMTCDYLKTRKQFGVTLNNFQALTHRAADMYVALELARSTVYWASIVRAAEDEGDAEANVSIAVAQAWLQMSRALRLIGPESIQMHGGIGMTAEYSVGHYVSRMIAIEHIAGDSSYHLSRLRSRIHSTETFEPSA